MARPRPAWRPPARDGVGASRVAATPGPWRTWGAFLPQRLPAAPDWPGRLARGDVLDVNGQPLRADSPCTPGQVAWYWRALPPEPRVPFEIAVLHQCEHLVAVDKPHFLPVTPGGRYLQETVLVRLKRALGIDTLVPLHRLDRETAGVLLFTVQPGGRRPYHELFLHRRVHKVYEAVAPWRADMDWPVLRRSRLVERAGEAFMQMQEVAGEANAETRVELLRRLPWGGFGEGDGHETGALAHDRPGPRAHYRLLPLTGRKHQLRAHMAALGLPIDGDRIYPRLLPPEDPLAGPDYRQPLQLLARELAFDDPVTGQRRCFTSRLQLQALQGDQLL
ncbi:MAG: pseudouridine synthase [Burkholderiaceae bacterium]|nr:pseudouridine synthase [Burkholderiaceae bacterium]